MKIIYRRKMSDRLSDAISYAEKMGLVIEAFELTEAEYDQLKAEDCFQRMKIDVDPESIKSFFLGAEIRVAK